MISMSVSPDAPGAVETVQGLRHFAARVLNAQDDFSELTDRALTEVLTAAVRLYSQRAADRELPDPLLRGHVTASDVGPMCLRMLRAVDLELFELTMWGGLGRTSDEIRNEAR